MPLHEPDATDPLELTAAGCRDETGQSMRIMTECFAEEFLRLGHSPADVMELFRGSEYRLAHRAWEHQGEVRVFAIVHEVASALSRRSSARPNTEVRLA